MQAQVLESWMCKFVPAWPESAEYLAELSGVVGLTTLHSEGTERSQDQGPSLAKRFIVRSEAA